MYINYPLSIAWYNLTVHQAWVVQNVDKAIHQINHYPVESVVCFVNTCPLESDLFGGYSYSAFKQPLPIFKILF